MRHKSSRCGFWHGGVHGDAAAKLFEYFGVKDDFELGIKLNDTFLAVYNGEMSYNHPNGDAETDLYRHIKNVEIPPLCELTDGDIELAGKLNWPDRQYCDFSRFESIKNKAVHAGFPIIGGSHCGFFTYLWDTLGMEEYFVKMRADPEFVTEITERTVGYYLAANEKFLNLYKKDVAGCFTYIDLGTQIDLMISPEMFDKFILPYLQKITEQAKKHGVYAVLHSCGSIIKAIPGIINSGFDALNPIQPLAAGMDPENLAQKYKDKIVFIGGVDTQILLREGTADQIKDNVRYLKDLFGNNFIVAPSQSIMPDMPPANIAAMAEAAWE